jgi:hypothetical protein
MRRIPYAARMPNASEPTDAQINITKSVIVPALAHFPFGLERTAFPLSGRPRFAEQPRNRCLRLSQKKLPGYP